MRGWRVDQSKDDGVIVTSKSSFRLAPRYTTECNGPSGENEAYGNSHINRLFIGGFEISLGRGIWW